MKNNTNSRLGWSIVGGHVLECFDNTLYGFFAVMLAPIFFPSESAFAALLSSYGAFAAGFVARPIGALIFGIIGDKYGRKTPLLWTMVFVGIPTTAIGLIPSYDTIGLIAPIILILSRLLQGFFMGGEFSGVNLFVSENYSREIIGSKTGFLISAGVYGAVLATLSGALVTSAFMPEWAWRIPFVIGGIGSLSVYLMRRGIGETLEFETIKNKNELLPSIWKTLLQEHKANLVLGIFIAGLTVIPLYCSTILGNKLFKELGYSTSESMLLNLGAMIFDALLITYCGKLADKVGFGYQMLMGTLSTFLIAFPAFYLVSGPEISTLNVYAFIGLLVATGCIINGCAMPYVALLFPTNCRYSGLAASVTIGHALLSGTTPLIGTYLAHEHPIAPAIWLSGISFLTFVGILLKEKGIFTALAKPRSASPTYLTTTD
jgi:MHS family proline/betaine transporter-like MFS transporter